MKKRFFKKNVLRDMLERDGLFLLVLILAVIFVEALYPLLELGSQKEVEIKPFEFKSIQCLFAAFAPFLFLDRLVMSYNMPQGRDLFCSLPVSRRSVFTGAAVMSFGGFGIFLLLDNCLHAVLFAVLPVTKVAEGYYVMKDLMLLSMFLFCFGLAMIIFSLSAGRKWYYMNAMIVLTECGLLYLASGRMLCYRVLNHVGGRTWDRDMYLNDGLSVYQVINGAFHPYAKFRALSDEILNADSLREPLYDSAFPAFFYKAALVTLLIGLAVLVIGYIAFVRRKAERADGERNSPTIHIAMQAMAVMLTMSLICFSKYYEYIGDKLDYGIARYPGPDSWNMPRVELPAMVPGIVLSLLILVPGLILWEILEKRDRKQWGKARFGLYAGLALEAIVFMYVYI
ncbi:MAG: hypothetical protein J5845_02405 [Lachnospiraceae bacterium]|nr:hypothetical protein [Lachnospiraceae bacterium]